MKETDYGPFELYLMNRPNGEAQPEELAKAGENSAIPEHQWKLEQWKLSYDWHKHVTTISAGAVVGMATFLGFAANFPSGVTDLEQDPSLPAQAVSLFISWRFWFAYIALILLSICISSSMIAMRRQVLLSEKPTVRPATLAWFSFRGGFLFFMLLILAAGIGAVKMG